ncbi:YSC84-related protein [Thiolapillus sp.]
MTKMKVRGIFISLLLLVFSAGQVWADECQDAVQLFQKAGDSARFFDNSYGYAVFPSIGKGGIGVGGAYGKGCVYAQGRKVGTATMTQVSIGFQLGGEAYTQIIFFQDKRAFEEFTSGNFEFSANAQAVAITAGASASASTAGNSAGVSGGQNDAKTVGASYNKGMATFVIAKGGLMYEASLAGQKYKYQPLGR